MQAEIRQLQQGLDVENATFGDLMALLNNEEDGAMLGETRSKRKRVDALLNAITQRPGQLRFNGGTTASIQGGSRNDSIFAFGVGSFDIYAHTTFGNNSLLFIDLEAIGGDGPFDRFPTFSALNGDAGSTQDVDGIDRVTVLEAWAEFTLLRKMVTVTAGKIDMTNYFDNNVVANDETMQFLSGSFVNSSAFAVPANSPGIRLRSTLLKTFHLQYGVSSVYNSGQDLFKEVYQIASVGFTILPESAFESNIRLYGYEHPLAEHGRGWGVSFDYRAFDAYNIFARYGSNDTKVAAYWGIESAWSVGTQFVKKFLKTSYSLGFAFGKNKPFLTQLKEEQIIEIYALSQLNEWIFISPHVQIVKNAQGTGNDFNVFGFRTNFIF